MDGEAIRGDMRQANVPLSPFITETTEYFDTNAKGMPYSPTHILDPTHLSISSADLLALVGCDACV